MSRQAHWESVFSTKAATDVSWFEAEPATSLELVLSVSTPQDSVIDVGAGAAHLVDRLLDFGYRDVSVLDVSATALNVVRERLQHRSVTPSYITADITQWIPDRSYDVWHDRAVFHFMTDQQMRSAYVLAASRAVKAGGHAIIGTFALDGPEACSGIQVSRHSPDTLAAQFAENFELIDSKSVRHRTPSGSDQSFVWAVLKRHR